MVDDDRDLAGGFQASTPNRRTVRRQVALSRTCSWSARCSCHQRRPQDWLLRLADGLAPSDGAVPRMRPYDAASFDFTQGG